MNYQIQKIILFRFVISHIKFQKKQTKDNLLKKSNIMLQRRAEKLFVFEPRNDLLNIYGKI